MFIIIGTAEQYSSTITAMSLSWCVCVAVWTVAEPTMKSLYHYQHLSTLTT